ncbi:MAG: TVP38/TMEM64 family protein, partial [Solirubrobacteraceae bacterium]
MSRRAALLRLALLAAVLAGCVVVLATSGSLSAQRVRDWVDGYGAAGPVVFVALSSLLTVVLFPGPLLAGASGLLFGTALGAPVALTAATLGASLAFCVARWWAHDAVEEVAGPRTRALREWVGRKGFLAVLYARIAPGVPYNAVNYAAGLTPVRLTSFAAA